VLAIAASMLGATDVVAIDSDPDALQSAAENIGLNGADAVVQARLADLGVEGSSLAASGRFDLVVANLTGAVLEQHATVLSALVAPGGSIIVSGCLVEEAASVEHVRDERGRAILARGCRGVGRARFTSPSASTAR
jgi:ribosomal protein L11 methyltransferase